MVMQDNLPQVLVLSFEAKEFHLNIYGKEAYFMLNIVYTLCREGLAPPFLAIFSIS